jgi:hypothetical protein
MSATTSRVSLYKPAGGENVNVTTDINNNMDKIDTNLNFRVAANVTARNAISPFWAGLNVRDTDSGKLWVSNGSAPISASWDQILTSGTYAAAANVNPSATGSVAINMKAAAEANNRWQVRGDGQLGWGGGSGAIDVNLYRANSTTLKTDDNFEATGTITTTGDIISTGGQLQLNLGGSAKKNAQPSTSVTLVSSAAETVVATYSIPANDMVAGAVYKLTVFGTVGTSTSPPTLNIRARIGGLTGSQFAQTGAISQNASNTTRVFKAEVYFVCLTTGVSGTGFGNLDVWNGAATGTPGTTNPTNFQNTTAVASSHIMDGGGTPTVNTTTTQDLVVTAQWTTSSANGTLIVRGFAAERVA